MLEGEELGVAPDSPPAESAPSPSPAGAQNTEQLDGAAQNQPQDKTQYVPYARFRQVIEQNRQIAGRLQQLEQLQARASQQNGQLSPQDQQEYRAAADALIKVFTSDPRLANLVKLAEAQPQIEQTMQGVSQLSRQRAQAQVQQGMSYVRNLAEKAGMTATVANQKAFGHLARMVAQEAMTLENGSERFDAGDMSVLEEAFKNVQRDVFGGVTRQASSQLLKTKQATQGLPPASRGGLAGQPAPPKPVPGKEREYTAGLHKRALAMLEDAAGTG